MQLLPAGGRVRRQIELPALPSGGSYFGDPDLAPDPNGRGGVLLSTLIADDHAVSAVSAVRVAVVRIPVSGAPSFLPSPSLAGDDD